MMTPADYAAEIRIAKQDAKLACVPLDPHGIIAAYLDAIEVRLSRTARFNRAGRAGFQMSHGVGDVGYVSINTTVCHTPERFRTTLLHELAHAICDWVHGEASDTHGPKWKAIMARLGQAPERCHKYTDRRL